MRKPWIVGGVARLLVLVVALFGGGCGDTLSTTNALLSFTLEVDDNPSLPAAVAGTIDEARDTVSLTVPQGTDLTALVPTFESNGTKVVVKGFEQKSGESAVDFTSPVTYRVVSASLQGHDYIVTVNLVPSTTKELTSFAFFDANNGALSADVTATINGNAVDATVPAGTDVTALIPTFVHTGASVTVGGIAQTSSVTANDFTGPVTYTVVAGDGSTRAYVVTVRIAASMAKDITAFSFLDSLNTALGADVTATINGTAIAATVPFGTNLTALIATFTTTGQAVRVGATLQVSGATPNDFTNPVMFEVTAADTTTKTYTVTITVSPGDQKDITSFAFLSANNAGLPADVTGTINGTAIAVTLPTGTNVSALVATFTQTGVSISVGGTPQVSGVTANNFTSPVMYLVTGGDTTTRTYTVTVTVALATAKDITAFSFLDGPNAALSADVTAVITGTSITATVPFGTNVTSLVATFTHTGSTVSIGVIPQTSGITSNNFTSSVMYTVTAADTSTQIYTVTVVIAASSAKDITAFSFLDVTNPALTVDVTATIAGTAISATVPFGTDLTALIATFTHTGQTVTVNGSGQFSGLSQVNFTNPVMYVVNAADTTTQTYTVTVTIAPNTQKDITSFSFLDASNPALDVDVTASVVTTVITLDVPPGTDLTALVATFVTSGASVSVAGTPQVSGTTPNNFTSPVTYLVTAADNSTRSYTVIVNTIRRFALPRLRASVPLAANPIDTTIRVVHANLAAGAAAFAELRIYAANGTLLTGPNGAVCNPCSAILDFSSRGATFSVRSRANAAGITTDVDAFGVVDVYGDSKAVVVSAFTSTQIVAGQNTLIDKVGVVEPPVTVTQRLLFGPGTEAAGAPTTMGNHDTRITMMNTAGSSALPATVALRLYNPSTGTLLMGQVAAICNPCNFVVNAANPRIEITVDALRTAAGLTTGSQSFLGTFDISGAGAGHVAVIAEKELGTTTSPSVVNRSLVPVHEERSLPPAANLRFVTPVFDHVTSHDHVLEIASFAGLGGAVPTASVTHNVYDDATGALMTRDNSTPVCSNCGGTIGAGFQLERSTIVSMATPNPVTPPKAGYVVTEISGPASSEIFATLSGVSITSGVGSTSILEQNAASGPRTFVLPHILETSGTTSTTNFTFDTTLFLTYTAGLPGAPSGAGASVDLFLFNDTGTPLMNNGASVCAPCSFAMTSSSPAARKQSIQIDNLITAQGGTFDASLKTGYGIIVVGGADPDNVNMQSFIVNRNTGASDLSVFGFEPQPINAN